jgi:hypothetical protein
MWRVRDEVFASRGSCVIVLSWRHSRCARAFGATLLLAAALPSTPAPAQGLFDFFFGGRPQRPYVPQTNAYADPNGPQYPVQEQPAAPSGRPVSYCVRLCDGRYFPVQHYVNVTPAQLCNSFCPASKTQVFNGSTIDYAVAPNGTRYADLDKAFVYRKQIVPGCTCNGRDTFGLARIDTAADPTLRSGDIVVTAEGPMSFKGGRWARAALDIKPAALPTPAPAREQIEPGDETNDD